MALVRVIGFALVVLTRQPCWWLEAAVREAPTVAGGVAAIREPVATVAEDTARLEERRARALPIQVALGLLGAAALLWALANLLQR